MWVSFWTLSVLLCFCDKTILLNKSFTNFKYQGHLSLLIFLQDDFNCLWVFASLHLVSGGFDWRLTECVYQAETSLHWDFVISSWKCCCYFLFDIVLLLYSFVEWCGGGAHTHVHVGVYMCVCCMHTRGVSAHVFTYKGWCLPLLLFSSL